MSMCHDVVLRGVGRRRAGSLRQERLAEEEAN